MLPQRTLEVMSTNRVVIYVPGLGDKRLRGQQFLVSTWRWWAVEPIIFQMKWADKEDFAPKFARLLHLIDDLHRQGKDISIVGTSAGATAAIHAFAARKDVIRGIVVICGKINRPEAIGKSYRRKNPAFGQSADKIQRSLDELSFETDRPRIYSRYAIFDELVPKQDSIVVGAKNHMVVGVGHAVTIATQLLLGAPSSIYDFYNSSVSDRITPVT